MPKYDRLWADYTEEARLAAKHGSSYDENQTLVTRTKQWKGKKSGRRDFHSRDQDGRLDSRPSSSRGDERKDYSKV